MNHHNRLRNRLTLKCRYTTDDKFELTAGVLEDLVIYQFYKKQITHYFCPDCKINVLTRAFVLVMNVRTVDGVDLEKLKLIPFDGENLL